MEAVRLCREAIGWEPPNVIPGVTLVADVPRSLEYDPLTDDAQAMALVRRFRINVIWFEVNMAGGSRFEPSIYMWADKPEALNRKIVHCVAALQQERERGK